MANDAHVCFTGFVATDPIYWPNQDGNSKASLRVAYTPRYVDRDSGEWTDSPTSFVSVTCWRKLADNIAMCVHKGDPVVIRGRLQVRQYDDKNGNPRVSVDVDAQSIGHDLSRGVARFLRTRRPAADATAVVGTDAADTDPDLECAPVAAPAGGEADEADDVLDDGAVAALLQGDGSPQLAEEGSASPGGRLEDGEAAAGVPS
jgi:single-strand DNA-binding protein